MRGLGPRGRAFESRYPDKHGSVAQSKIRAYTSRNRSSEVEGWSPFRSTNNDSYNTTKNINSSSGLDTNLLNLIRWFDSGIYYLGESYKFYNYKIMASFKERLGATGKNVLDARAANIAEMTQIEASNVVASYKTKVLRLKNQIENHADLAVESTHSLRPGSKDFDPKTWVDSQIQFQKDLRIAKIEYNLVKKWYDEMFPADEEVVDTAVEEDDE